MPLLASRIRMGTKKDFILQSHHITAEGCKGAGSHKLYSFDVYSDVTSQYPHRFVEVQFKSTRKEYFFNPLDIPLTKEDMVAVEGSPGLDIGRVSLVGPAVDLQMRLTQRQFRNEPKQIYRIATEHDLQRYHEAKSLEHRTMIEARKIATEMGLEMKIGDVEYQGDGTKAIFYYIAEGRVDFRQLIRVLAATFHIRIEMKQIGARQESGRIGGIGACGRQLCCSSWMKRFQSVNTQAARFQDLQLNPDKLTGQCGKLKCCTNFEVDTYVEAQKYIPNRETALTTEEGIYTFLKADILKGTVSYKLEDQPLAPPIEISTYRARQVINANREGETPKELNPEKNRENSSKKRDILDDNSLTRFDENPKPKKSASLRGRNPSTGEKTAGNRARRQTNYRIRKKSSGRSNERE